MTQKQTDYNWIMNIIDSCTNEFQIKCCVKLIQAFANKHKDADLAQALANQNKAHSNAITKEFSIN